MTREDNDKAISNKERAELATEEGADITVRIHANGANDSASAGALTMAPTSSNQYLSQDIIEKSNTTGNLYHQPLLRCDRSWKSWSNFF